MDSLGTPVEDENSLLGPDDANNGVLLYYKYVDLGEEGRAVVKEWYDGHCAKEQLRGRVRVALDGVNCTLGGTLSALERHIAGIKTNEQIRGEDIDFKLSSSRGARNSQAAVESGFTTMSVKAVKEVVSMGARGADLSPGQGGRHVSPEEFHGLLEAELARRHQHRSLLRDDRNFSQSDNDRDRNFPENSCDSHTNEGSHLTVGGVSGMKAGGCAINVDGGVPREGTRDEVLPASGDATGERRLGKDVVLLDVRNVYETSIGHFSVQGVETLDPKTRQFSDFPAWVDGNADRLSGKRVLMYCTGGVRCEMASAFVLQRCNTESTGTEVMQLSGGIERYLQAYPSRDLDACVAGGSLGDNASEGFDESGDICGGTGMKGGGAEEDREAEMRQGMEGEGFFRGKNFVFDERVSVPETPAGGSVVGHCLLCRRPWDDYGSRSRCSRCRMLVLVCDSCVELRTCGDEDLCPTPLSNNSGSLEISPMTDGPRSVPAAVVPQNGEAPALGGRELICSSCNGRRGARS